MLPTLEEAQAAYNILLNEDTVLKTIVINGKLFDITVRKHDNVVVDVIQEI